MEAVELSEDLPHVMSTMMCPASCLELDGSREHVLEAVGNNAVYSLPPHHTSRACLES